MGSTGTQREIVKVEFMDTTGFVRSLSESHKRFWTQQIENRPELFHVYKVDADTTAYAPIDTMGNVTGVIMMTFAPEKTSAQREIMTLKNIPIDVADSAIAARRRVRVVSGPARGRTGNLSGYNNTYGTYKVRLVDETGAFDTSFPCLPEELEFTD